MAKCAHCGDSGGEDTTMEISRLLRRSKLEIVLCRDCYASLVDFIEHGDTAEEEQEDAAEEEEDGEGYEEDD